MSEAVLRLKHRALSQKAVILDSVKVNFKLIYAMAFVGFLALLIFYIFGINQLIEGTYTIKNYNKEIKSLLAENRTLEVNATQGSFLGLTQDKAKELNFEKSTNVAYVQALQNSFAEAK